MARLRYESSSELEYSQTFRWVKLSSFCTVLHDLCTVEFDSSFKLSEARTKLIDALSTPFPFSKNCRFPEKLLLEEVFGPEYRRFPKNDMYVCVDKPLLFAQVAEVMRVLATPPYLMLTAESIKDYFSAIACMRELMHSQVDGDRVVFSRETFEREFELNWVD
ncbi:hypothetical protein FH972_000996 [Carpinus fangiana]|uniref:Uncharacterized protein n=1 Tax=Carpinus fangiana TaxID=176857 RepID=A0A5N6QAD8_9ROSI|nr:hypothetical protein FH972_000996 [Carpinus fangiana]